MLDLNGSPKDSFTFTFLGSKDVSVDFETFADRTERGNVDTDLPQSSGIKSKQ